MRHHRSMRRRGVTLVEVVVSSLTVLLLLTTVGALVVFSSKSFARTDMALSAKQKLGLAVARMEPTVRAALRVDAADSGQQPLTLVLPRVDGATGEYALPLSDGDRISFYLSNQTGSPTAQGTILWRSVNGTPDTTWSLRRGGLDLRNSGLRFTYYGSPQIGSVAVTVTADEKSGNLSVRQSASTELFLRNQSYRNQ